MSIAEHNAPLPRNIGRIIQEKGLKQSAVARWAGYSNQQLTDMLNGRKLIKPCDAKSIAKALGVSIAELFTDTGQDSA